jgi:hypothetical protein
MSSERPASTVSGEDMMKRSQRLSEHVSGSILALCAVVVLIGLPSRAAAQGPAPATATPALTATAPDADDTAAPQPAAPAAHLDIYGFAMLDMGYEAKQSDPNWFDVLRPTKLPAFPNQYGEDGHFFAGVRQSRFGVAASVPTDLGEMKTVFEFELFGTGVDAGQTTFRLRKAYGELGHFLAGQTNSPFMDGDVFPNSIEYWGPNGMVFFRNVQVRWMPLMGDTSVALALERPGASADQGVYADRIELQNVKGRFPLPDFSGNVRRSGKWGHVQVAGILREMKWDDTLTTDQFNLSGSATGWGINISTNINNKINDKTSGVFRGSFVYGHGIENYMNDAPVDVGIQNNLGNPVTPIVGKALPVTGIVAFYDINWNPKWTSTVGWSMLNIENSDAQLPSEYHQGHYVLGNLLFHPLPDLFAGGELQWGKRINNSDGFSSDDFRIQFSVKYSFKFSVGGK